MIGVVPYQLLETLHVIDAFRVLRLIVHSQHFIQKVNCTGMTIENGEQTVQLVAASCLGHDTLFLFRRKEADLLGEWPG